jgi:hypothetical protein
MSGAVLLQPPVCLHGVDTDNYTFYLSVSSPYFCSLFCPENGKNHYVSVLGATLLITCCRMEVAPNAFYTSALDGCHWSAYRFGYHIPGQTAKVVVGY